MTDGSELTFRDFAAAALGGDGPKAAQVLQQLIPVSAEQAQAATDHFMKNASASPAFVGKAMGLRQVVTGGDAQAASGLLQEVFGLEGALADKSAAQLLTKYS